MRIGLIARADRTGLAAQTWSFWRNMNPAATLVVDLSRCSGQRPEMVRYVNDDAVTSWQPNGYPNNTFVPEQVLEDFLDRVDVVFTVETPYNHWLFHRAREKGVRTVLQVNPEFLDYLLDVGIAEPDCFALPTRWLEDQIRAKLPGREIVRLPVPVDRELLPFRHRPRLQTILHTAGTPALADRNGTGLLIEAMRHVRSPVHLIIRTQKDLGHLGYLPPNVSVSGSTDNFWELYSQGDLYVMPRKFGGLCLPQQEALSVGMPVLMSDLAPQNDILPPELLMPAAKVMEVMTKTMINVYEVHPQTIARSIDWLYENPYTFADLSTWAGTWGSANCWEELRPVYDRVLRG